MFPFVARSLSLRAGLLALFAKDADSLDQIMNKLIDNFNDKEATDALHKLVHDKLFPPTGGESKIAPDKQDARQETMIAVMKQMDSLVQKYETEREKLGPSGAKGKFWGYIHGIAKNKEKNINRQNQAVPVGEEGAMDAANQNAAQPPAAGSHKIGKELHEHVVTLYNAIEEILTSPPTNKELLSAIAAGKFDWQDFLQKATGVSISEVQDQYSKAVEAHEKGDDDGMDHVGSYMLQKVLPRLKFLSGGRTTKMEGQLAKHHELAAILGHEAVGAKDKEHMHAFFKTETENRAINSLKSKLQKNQIDKATYDKEVAAIEAKIKNKLTKSPDVNTGHLNSMTSRMYGIHMMMNREQQRMKASYDKALAAAKSIPELQKEYRESKNKMLGLNKTAFLSKREIV